ncbi:MAG TPA: NAD(P)/FAD-dependent oxidoreductase [Polyangiales bacterium]
MKPEYEVIIVGTGFAGLGMAIRLKQAGIHNFVILEKDDGVGGTWRANSYPGAACDVQSHLYSFSFEQNPNWSRMFAEQKEILAYLEHCTDKYHLRPHLRCNVEVKRGVYNEDSASWQVELSNGQKLSARFLVSGCGGLSRPSYPKIAGLESFQGAMFHTARWRHDVDLSGKRVAVIGTGASAIQVVPAIVDKVKKLKLFQRTPPWIMEKPDRAIGAAEKRLYARFPRLQRAQRARLYSTLEARVMGFVVMPRVMEQVEKRALSFMEEQIKDPTLRKRLTPNYRIGCKRVLMSNEYFGALQRPNAELVTDGIREIRAHSVVTQDGSEHEVDAVILATGFQAADAVAPFDLRGKGGLDINEEWRAGAEAYKGTTVAGFPNLFVMVGPNTGLGHSSMVYMIESQIQYAIEAIAHVRARGLASVEVRRDAQRRYNAELQQRMSKTVWATGGCTSWYTTADGKNTTLWPGFTFQFRKETEAFDAENYDAVQASALSESRAPAEAAAPAAE